MEMNSQTYFEELTIALSKVNTKEVDGLIEAILETRENGGRVFVFGNGGSMATAVHFAADLTKNTKGFMGIALDNIALFSAYANDMGYHTVFTEQLLDYGCGKNDMLIGLSTSGKSQNVLDVMGRYGRVCKTYLLTSAIFDVKGLNVVLVQAPTIEMMEDIHSIILHSVIKCLKDLGASPKD